MRSWLHHDRVWTSRFRSTLISEPILAAWSTLREGFLVGALSLERQLVNRILRSLLNQLLTLSPVLKFSVIHSAIDKGHILLLLWITLVQLGSHCEWLEVYSGSSLHVHLVRINYLMLLLKIESLLSAFHVHLGWVTIREVFAVVSNDVGWVRILNETVDDSLLALPICKLY